ncbi:MAG TPA: molybdate ABC transporter substrate-binding protein [Solirubrobacteraceae bacterium]|nr:molybdate ABC transporter substrate-binding protein [Solirubrobacteraceae bacterium]
MRSARTRASLAALLCALLAAAAGGGGASAATGTSTAGLTVYAAASLTDVFPAIDPNPKYSFAGSNTLAAQIQLGAPADVFASANTQIPAALYAKGLVDKPVDFTRNTLVIVVPTSNPGDVHSIYDLTKPGVTISIANSAVPVGSYTLQILGQMNLTSAVLKNVVSQESDVRDVLSQVALGQVDAGFVYSTDAETVPGQVKVVTVPAWAQPKVTYAIAVVKSSPNQAAAQAFVAEILGKAGQRKLTSYGFLPLKKPTEKIHTRPPHKKKR